MNCYTKALAKELGAAHKIRVNIVTPGGVETPGGGHHRGTRSWLQWAYLLTLRHHRFRLVVLVYPQTSRSRRRSCCLRAPSGSLGRTSTLTAASRSKLRLSSKGPPSQVFCEGRTLICISNTPYTEERCRRLSSVLLWWLPPLLVYKALEEASQGNAQEPQSPFPVRARQTSCLVQNAFSRLIPYAFCPEGATA